MAKGLLDNDTRVLVAARLPKLFHHGLEHGWRDREIVRRPLRGAEFFADGHEGCRILVVSIHIVEQADQLVGGLPVDASVLFETLPRPRPKLVEIPPGL